MCRWGYLLCRCVDSGIAIVTTARTADVVKSIRVKAAYLVCLPWNYVVNVRCHAIRYTIIIYIRINSKPLNNLHI